MLDTPQIIRKKTGLGQTIDKIQKSLNLHLVVLENKLVLNVTKRDTLPLHKSSQAFQSPLPHAKPLHFNRPFFNLLKYT